MINKIREEEGEEEEEGEKTHHNSRGEEERTKENSGREESKNIKEKIVQSDIRESLALSKIIKSDIRCEGEGEGVNQAELVLRV